MPEKFAKLKKYNFWDANFPDAGLLREKYLEKINDFIGNKLIKRSTTNLFSLHLLQIFPRTF